MAAIRGIQRDPEDPSSAPTTWLEDEVKCQHYLAFHPHRGKTGKGHVEFYADRGGFRVFDVEDIVSIARTPQLHRR